VSFYAIPPRFSSHVWTLPVWSLSQNTCALARSLQSTQLANSPVVRHQRETTRAITGLYSIRVWSDDLLQRYKRDNRSPQTRHNSCDALPAQIAIGHIAIVFTHGISMIARCKSSDSRVSQIIWILCSPRLRIHTSLTQIRLSRTSWCYRFDVKNNILHSLQASYSSL